MIEYNCYKCGNPLSVNQVFELERLKNCSAHCTAKTLCESCYDRDYADTMPKRLKAKKTRKVMNDE